MTGRVLDLERRVLTDRAPRDAGRAQIVEPELPLRLRRRVELGAGHAGHAEVLAQLRREVPFFGEAGQHTALAVDGGAHPFEHGYEGGLEGDAARRAGLRRALDAALVQRAVDLHARVREVHVLPQKAAQLGGAQVGVGGDGVDLACGKGHRVAGDELRELARVEVDLRLLGARFGAAYVASGVVVADAEGERLRSGRVVKQLAHEVPRVLRRLPADDLVLHFAVEVFDPAL
ncbi:MAG TPA: hypothetical protein VGM56_08500, partial [Byssovorax sp.]